MTPIQETILADINEIVGADNVKGRLQCLSEACVQAVLVGVRLNKDIDSHPTTDIAVMTQRSYELRAAYELAGDIAELYDSEWNKANT